MERLAEDFNAAESSDPGRVVVVVVREPGQGGMPADQPASDTFQLLMVREVTQLKYLVVSRR